jgi:hypothetical protein
LRTVPLDHFEKTDCGRKIHPDYANAVLRSRREHYAQGVVEVSHALGCPRSYAIQNAEDYAVDPLSLNSMETGTAWHHWMQRASVDPEMTEVELDGEIDGVRIVGKCDRLRQDQTPTAIEDWKHSNDFRAKYLKSEGVPLTYQVQLSLYAELCEQNFGWRPEIGRIWFHTTGGDGLMPKEVTLFSVEEALVIRPTNGTLTVRELLHQADDHFAKGRPWQKLTLAGESMMFGQKNMCSYCQVRDLCWTQSRGAPF